MAYCRWSSDNWKSDVYVYESNRGIEIYVAGMRYAGEAPEGDYYVDGKYNAEHYKAVHDWLASAERVEIGGPSDGKCYVCEREDALTVLDRLRTEGYHVPQYAIDEIRKELEENGNE